MANKLSNRGEARTRLTRSRGIVFKLVEYEGDEVAVKLPSIGSKEAILEASMTVDKSGAVIFHAERQKVAALIAMVHTVKADGQPGEAIFEDGDREVLLGWTADGQNPVDALGRVCVEYMKEHSATKEEVKREVPQEPAPPPPLRAGAPSA